MTSVLGADGCRGGWIGALVSGANVSWQLFGSASEFLALPVDVIAVDIPIGLPASGVRQCDVLARRVLPGQGSSVFPAPIRPVLAARSYAEARRISVAVDGRSLSAQCFGILPKIAEVDAMVRAAKAEVLEVHPEVSFGRLAGHRLPPKRSAAGALARVQLLVDVFGPLPTDAPPAAGLDDCLDALVCAWSAQRWLRGEAEALGGEVDDTGQVMRIVI